MSDGGKKVHLAAKVPEELLAAIDEYQQRREQETRVPLTRSIVVREILSLGMAAISAGWEPKELRARTR